MSVISQPTWLEDTPTRCRVFFFHGGPTQNHLHNLGFFVSPGNNWWIPSLNVSEGRRPLGAGGDFVNIVAGTAMQHIVAVPGHVNDFPFGTPAAFGPMNGGPAMNAAAFPQGGFMRAVVDVPHARGHVDDYELTLTISVNGPRIRAYRISFTAEHIAMAVKKLPRREKAQAVKA